MNEMISYSHIFQTIPLLQDFQVIHLQLHIPQKAKTETNREWTTKRNSERERWVKRPTIPHFSFVINRIFSDFF